MATNKVGRITDKATIDKYLNVGQTLNLISQSMVTRSAYTEKTLKRTISKIVPEEKYGDAYVNFKGDSKIFAVFVRQGVISFRWKSPKREYIWMEGPTVKESLIEKYLEK